MRSNSQAFQSGTQENNLRFETPSLTKSVVASLTDHFSCSKSYLSDSWVPDFFRYSSPNAALDAAAMLNKVHTCDQLLTKRKPIPPPVRRRRWARRQSRGAIPPSATCRSKSFFVAFATPTFIQFATNGANSWRRTIQSFPAMRSSAV